MGELFLNQGHICANLFDIYTNIDIISSKEQIEFMDIHFPGLTKSFLELVNYHRPNRGRGFVGSIMTHVRYVNHALRVIPTLIYILIG